MNFRARRPSDMRRGDVRTAGSSGYEPGAWVRAKQALGDPDLPEDARHLSSEEAQVCGARLSDAGWSYRMIAPALAVSKSTVGRWFVDETWQPATTRSGEGLGLIGLLLGAGIVAGILKMTLGKDPRPQPPTGGDPIRGPWPPRGGGEDGEAP